MPKIKGINISQMRNFFKAEPNKEALFLQKLPVRFHDVYQKTKPHQWVPDDISAEIFTCGAPILFPDDPEPLIKLGETVARKLYGGAYAFFFKIPTVEFAMKYSVNFWYLFLDSGRYGYENYTGHSIDIFAKDYPELPLAGRKIIIGNIKVVFELIGVKPYAIELINDDPNNWRWHIEFEKQI